MEWLYTWGGRSFGYKDGDRLYTHDGRNVGKFYGNEIYGQDRAYLGEIRNQILITNTSKKGNRKSGFVQNAGRVGMVNRIDRVGNVMVVGFEDFPKLEK